MSSYLFNNGDSFDRRCPPKVRWIAEPEELGRIISWKYGPNSINADDIEKEESNNSLESHVESIGSWKDSGWISYLICDLKRGDSDCGELCRRKERALYPRNFMLVTIEIRRLPRPPSLGAKTKALAGQALEVAHGYGSMSYLTVILARKDAGGVSLFEVFKW